MALQSKPLSQSMGTGFSNPADPLQPCAPPPVQMSERRDKNSPRVRGIEQYVKSMQSGRLPVHSVPFFTSLILWWSVTLESKHYRHKTLICCHCKEAGLQPWAVSISQVLWALTSLEFCNFWSNFHGFCLKMCKKCHSDSVLQCCWVDTQGKMPVFSLTIFTSTR